MSKFTARTLFAAALGLMAAEFGFAALDAAEAADRLIRRCSAEGAGDISMATRFERRDGGRRKFTVEMEAAPGGSLREGQRIDFSVGAVRVGTVQLVSVVGGDLVADLNFDTNAGPGDDEDPFPRNFPQIAKGTKVKAAFNGDLLLSCAMR